MKLYWIDCEKFCGSVEIDDNGIILKTMPVFKKFINQPVKNLTKWASKQFGYCAIKEVK